jgi:predicted nucleotidyltransferase component of viral defense system
MGDLKENRNCYASEKQRDILKKLLEYEEIGQYFFLTGGTALSVFYLHHRTSEDLDLFTIKDIRFGEIDYWIKTYYQKRSTTIKASQNFLSYLIEGIKVDLVRDRLSLECERPRFNLEQDHSIMIDVMDNIVSNKLNTIVSRTEPKDYIDFYYIMKRYPQYSNQKVYQAAKKKDAIFEDPATVAYQIEEGIGFLNENPQLMPSLNLDLDKSDFELFYKNFTQWIYNLQEIH